MQTRETQANGKVASPISIVGNAVSLALADWVALTMAFLFLTVPPIWSGIYLPEDDALRLSAMMGIAALIPQILLIERALWRCELMEAATEKRRSYFPSAFGQSLIAGLCVIVGLLALIIPGLFLIARWSISLPVLIARNEGVTQSLGTSWEYTRNHFWLCLLSVLCAWAPLAAVAIAAILSGRLSFEVETVFVESLLSIAMLLSWFVSVALYAEIATSKKVG